MALEFSICEVRWERYPRVSENAHARDRPKTCVARKIHAHSRLAEMQVVADHRWSAGPLVRWSRLFSCGPCEAIPEPKRKAN
jgi:hypothetical protein